MLINDSRCPCSSGLRYSECCGRVHAGAKAPSAEALMRARFTAFVTNDADFLRASWHPSRRPKELDLDAGLTWRRLEILSHTGGPFDARATVEFNAHYRNGDERLVLHENSEFVREGGEWFYLRGTPTL